MCFNYNIQVFRGVVKYLIANDVRWNILRKQHFANLGAACCSPVRISCNQAERWHLGLSAILCRYAVVPGRRLDLHTGYS